MEKRNATAGGPDSALIGVAQMWCIHPVEATCMHHSKTECTSFEHFTRISGQGRYNPG
jgi:hypothetical protein